jgi:hypothetical protein
VADASEIPPVVADLVAEIVGDLPVHQRFLDKALREATGEELEQLAAYLTFCCEHDLDVAYLARCYLTLVEDTVEEQLFFNRHHRYRHSTFADVADHVYHDREYMNRYMYGLAISTFVWPNHVQMARFFRARLPRQRRGRYLEVGPGHGYLFLTAMRLSRYDEFLGVDLSAASIAQTAAIVDAFCPGRPVRLEEHDFLDAGARQLGRFDAIVAGEVLEHVEQPAAILRRISELAAPDAFIFVTTCVNAPAIDHIYLWRSTDELEAMIEANGLRLVDALRLPYEGTTLEESRDASLPVNVAYVLAPVTDQGVRTGRAPSARSTTPTVGGRTRSSDRT